MSTATAAGQSSGSHVMYTLWNVTTTARNLIDEQESASASAEENETSTASYRRISFAIAWLTLALCIFGLVGNAFSIIIYAHPTMRSPINVLLMGTSHIDFILSFLSVPTFVIPGIYAYYNTSILKALMAYSSAYIYPLTLMMQSASVWAFVVITIERYQAVCRPFRAKLSTVQRSRLALIVVCILAIAYNAVRFFEFRIEYGEEVPGNNTDHNKTGDSVNVVTVLRDIKAYMNVYYIGMFLVTHFVLPFAVLVILNSLIIRTICQSRQRRRALNRKERSEHRTAVMMVIVVLTFIGCYTLLFILNILEAANPDWFYETRHMALLFALNDISNVLVVTNAASTIIVYYFFCQKYRELLVLLLARILPRACIKYMQASASDQGRTLATTEDEIKMERQNGDRTTAPLLSINRSRPHGFAYQLSTTTVSSNLLTPRAARDVRVHLLAKSDAASPSTVENDIDGIISDMEEA